MKGAVRVLICVSSVFDLWLKNLAKRAATTRFAATARCWSSSEIEKLASRLGVGQVAEVILDGFAMALRHALGQLLQSPGLFARGQRAPVLHQLLDLGDIYIARTALGHEARLRGGVLRSVAFRGTVARLTAGTIAAVGSGPAFVFVLQLLNELVEAGGRVLFVLFRVRGSPG